MITVQLKLIPTDGQDKLLKQTAAEYISSANDLLEYCCAQVGVPKLSSSSFSAPLPSAVKNEVVNTVKSILRKHKMGRHAPRNPPDLSVGSCQFTTWAIQLSPGSRKGS